jgi:polysaccharide export outer membrane protein
MMPCSRRILAALTITLIAGCKEGIRPGGTLPPPINVYTIGPGDRFEIAVIGESSFPKEYVVSSDGTVDFPFLHRQRVAGYEAQDMASHVRDLLVEGGFFRDPVVIVSVKEFNSKRVTIGGAVTKPGDVPFMPNLTLLRVITGAGGFTAVASHNNVLITRRLPDGQRATASFSVDAISEGRASDVLLQAGDNIYVYERNF